MKVILILLLFVATAISSNAQTFIEPPRDSLLIFAEEVVNTSIKQVHTAKRRERHYKKLTELVVTENKILKTTIVVLAILLLISL